MQATNETPMVDISGDAELSNHNNADQMEGDHSYEVEDEDDEFEDRDDHNDADDTMMEEQGDSQHADVEVEVEIPSLADPQEDCDC